MQEQHHLKGERNMCVDGSTRVCEDFPDEWGGCWNLVPKSSVSLPLPNYFNSTKETFSKSYVEPIVPIYHSTHLLKTL